MTLKVDLVILAGGAATRMRGGDKSLERVNGQPLIKHLAMEGEASHARKSVVVLPPDRPERNVALDGTEARIIIAEDAASGMAASIKAGIMACTDADAVILALADMPEITRAHLDQFITRFESDSQPKILQATDETGRPGHPVLFPRCHFEALMQLEGDTGARQIIAANDVERIALDGQAATLDLDTPEDWARWRTR